MRGYLPGRCFLPILAIAVMLVAPAVWAAEAQDAKAANGAAAAPNGGPVIEAVQVEGPPVIDGKLDDACWAKATRLESFYCGEYDGPAPEETIGFVCVSDQAIYVAVICNDKTPDDIAAAETRRNGDLGNDDFVRVGVDPSHNHRDFYAFDVNAAGTQRDNPPGDSAAKIEWRGDWKAAACRMPTGWQAEFAIPFSALRCQAGQTTFGLGIQRYLGKDRVHATWPNMGKTEDRALSADLTGLHPCLTKARPIFMPYVTIDSGDGFERGVDAGLDVQYKLPNGLTTLASFNPDFRQIEDVVEPISFSYTERFLRDPRPFFVTGSDGYLPREHLLYTRRIKDFDAGVKVFGTVGNDTIGLFDAVTFGEENSLAAGLTHRFGDDFNAKLLMVSHRQLGEPNNLAYGLDACYKWRRPNGYDNLWTVLYQSQTQGVGSGGSYAIGGTHDRGPGTVYYDWMLRRLTPNFNPALGYFPDPPSIGGSLNFQQTDIYDKGSLFARQWALYMQYYPFLDGSGMYRSQFAPAYAWLTRGGQLYVVQVERGRYFGFDNANTTVVHGWHNNDTYRRGELDLAKGKAAGGDLFYARFDQGLKPTSRLCLRVVGEYTALDLPEGSTHDYQAVLTTSYDLTTEKSVAARAIWRNDGFSAYAAYRQVVRKGMDAYVIVGDPDPARTGFTNRLVVKLIWAM